MSGSNLVDLKSELRTARRRCVGIEAALEVAHQERAGLEGLLGRVRAMLGRQESAIAEADAAVFEAETALERVQDQVADLEARVGVSIAARDENKVAAEALASSRERAVQHIGSVGGAESDALALLDSQLEVMQQVILGDGALELTGRAQRQMEVVVGLLAGALPPYGRPSKSAKRLRTQQLQEFQKCLATYRAILVELDAALASTPHADVVQTLPTVEVPAPLGFVEEREVTMPSSAVEYQPVLTVPLTVEAERLVALSDALNQVRGGQSGQLAAVEAERHALLDRVAAALD